MRQKFRLSLTEYRQFSRLKPFEGEAFQFWCRVAKSRGLDPASIISNGEYFTGLPKDHGKHWCFPIPLKCQRKPSYTEEAHAIKRSA